MLRNTYRVATVCLATLVLAGCGGGDDTADLTGTGGGSGDAATDTSSGGGGGSGGSAGKGGAAGLGGAAGTGGEAGGDASADVSSDAGPDAPPDTAPETSTPVCAKGDFKCEGDVLQTCMEDGSAFITVTTCKPGLCDAPGKQCDNCTADEAKCLTATRLQSCSADGQMVTESDCPSSSPHCAAPGGVSKCVECIAAADCKPSTNECQLAACGTDGVCGLTSVAADTPCGLPGSGGKCDGTGACLYCTPGETRCAGVVPEACDNEGKWVQGAACSGTAAVCLAGACVQCDDATDCPASANECSEPICDAVHACGYSPKGSGTACAGGLGKCDGAGQCNVCTPGTAICNGNVPLLCGSDGQYAPQPACSGETPYCDPVSGECVQCSNATQCAVGNECLTASCTANVCGYVPKTPGTACTGGTCSALGTCQACTPGTVKCVGESVQSCNSNGQWDPTVACASPKPYCEDASATCVECEAPAQCPAPANECLTSSCTGFACGFLPKASGTSCAAGVGKCDGAGQCNVCTPGSAICNGNVPLLCGSNGQYAAQPACSGATPNCNPATGTCVECSVASQCEASSNPCLDAVCTSNACGFAPKTLGTSCPGGTCSGTGVCWACTPGTEVCDGNGTKTCNSSGQYDAVVSCVAPEPYCETGSVECVQCLTAGQCTTPANPCLQATCIGYACGIGNKADGTSCAVGVDTGTCSSGNCRVCTTGAKRCKTGVTDVAQTCDSNGQWQDTQTCSGGTPVCMHGECTSGCNALAFDGINDLVTIPQSTSFNYPGSFTVEAWVVTKAGTQYQRLLAHDSPSDSAIYTGWELDLQYGANIRFQFEMDGTKNVQAPVTTGVWHHVAGVYETPGTMSLFVDGVKVATKSSISYSAFTIDKPIGLGRDTEVPSGYPWAGSIGPTRISNVARYSSTFAPTWGWTTDANTLAVWNFGEGNGTTLGDSSGGGHNGTISGAVWSPITCPTTPAPTWKLMGTKSAQVMFGSCAHTETKSIPCSSANLGSEVRIFNNDGVELKDSTVDVGAYQGMSATLSGSTMSLTGRTGCGSDILQTRNVTYYMCY